MICNKGKGKGFLAYLVSKNSLNMINHQSSMSRVYFISSNTGTGQSKTMQQQHKFQGRSIFIHLIFIVVVEASAAQLVLGQDTTTFVTEFPGLLANVDTIAISKARKDANALFHSELHITC